MTLRDVWIYKSKSSRFVTFKKINLHSHQEHVVFFLDQNRNAMNFKLLILRLGLIKSCLLYTSDAADE